MPKDLQDVAAHTTSREVIDTSQHASELEALGKRWSIVDKQLLLTLPGTMTQTGRVAAFAGVLADEIDHHPQIILDHAGLALSIQTEEKHAITVLDLVFAARLEQWLRENGFPA